MTYNTEQLSLQPTKPPHGFLQQLLTKGQVFPFTKANDTIALSLAGEVTPSYLKDIEDDNKSLYWNEERLNSEALSGWSQFYTFLLTMTKILLILFLPLFYLIFLFPLLFSHGSWSERWDDLSAVFYGLTLYFTLPCLLIWGHYKLVCKGYYFLAPFLKSKPVYSLNRQTGMVTLYKRGNKVRFTHPFIEFDCVLMSAPSPQGHLNYNLMLVHRYQPYSVGVPISNLIGTNERVVEYQRFWNMIQRYMDVSQPMPDLLVLEEARAKDPVTAAHDQQTGRDPRYWRDMSDDTYKKTLAEIAEKQKTSPATGPKINIFADS
ncbi:hypothetical protein BZG20_12140 [Salinivibrio sp. IB868]|uniref:hypothetical protein n=1 Tax=unclassified Salinivibrio TaxID=2636825 RepID=UPI000985462F|nr:MULTISPECIES: hypothetical protein [unclassified Salinivibrio]OOE65614.1 hypothetical protein BZG20_12140 [Salinivibrio sp. IB868]OOE74252.1 hypothetical protein BZG22_08965 [Salinivibrio sp. IB870]